MHAFEGLRLLDLTDRLPALDKSTVIGITVAIVGNVLISLALNIQKLAHNRLDEEKTGSGHTTKSPSLNENDEMALEETDSDELSDHTVTLIARRASQSEPLLPTQAVQQQYGSTEPSSPSGFSRFFKRQNVRETAISVDVISPGASNARRKSSEDELSRSSDENETAYLKSKLWWTGFLLMNVGELGNFISYAWAPASVVAPLGTFALIANCFFAPLLIKENFHKRELVGIFLAIVGAVTVVLSSNTSDARLDADGLLHAIAQLPFIIYTAVYIAGAAVLSTLSNKPVGHRYVVIDVGLCALFGGFTVLSTKAVSTLLTMDWIRIFTHPITYPVILVLALTGVAQIRYLNRALMKFDSKVVIPTQFVLFNLSAIVGSAILYGDFKKATFHSLVTFLYGCAATFAGVFVISSTAPAAAPDLVDSPTVEDDVESNHTNSDANIARFPSQRPALILPKDPPRHIRNRPSIVSLTGLSNGHHLLLLRTPQRENATFNPWDSASSPGTSPDAYHRNRAMSWFGESSPRASVDHNFYGRARDFSPRIDGRDLAVNGGDSQRSTVAGRSPRARATIFDPSSGSLSRTQTRL
ncbi:DUF803-domain-containing protein [Cylindrobasidium torrendii FP15055 ss-10]|uniref:DUF803-domain-containing protein n=1 Tax=Cylindrobasidium torrendii FP15055 ss-10 TaxID=1314674 RepID=A0A0D7BQY3_9AGAR|nr:DUF803-domain-containing protein [Cylindrobasidium torrendii FP15055 ss-10]